MAASVWIAPAIRKSVSDATLRSTAETIPTDSDCACPNGDPIAATGSPTLHLLAVAERQRPQRQALRIDAQERDVGVRIVAEHARLDAVAVRELDVDLGRAPDRLALARW